MHPHAAQACMSPKQPLRPAPYPPAGPPLPLPLPLLLPLPSLHASCQELLNSLHRLGMCPVMCSEAQMPASPAPGPLHTTHSMRSRAEAWGWWLITLHGVCTPLTADRGERLPPGSSGTLGSTSPWGRARPPGWARHRACVAAGCSPCTS